MQSILSTISDTLILFLSVQLLYMLEIEAWPMFEGGCRCSSMTTLGVWEAVAGGNAALDSSGVRLRTGVWYTACTSNDHELVVACSRHVGGPQIGYVTWQAIGVRAQAPLG